MERTSRISSKTSCHVQCSSPIHPGLLGGQQVVVRNGA